MIKIKIGIKEVEIAVPLKYLGNFWETLDIPLINCEVCLALTWSANFVITSMKKRITTGTNRGDSLVGATFKITDTKLYVPVTTLSAENDNKLLEQLKTGFLKQELLNGINADQKCLIRLQITI